MESPQEIRDAEERTWDIAISFLAADVGIATAIGDRLSGKLDVFVFPRNQETLAGTDGVELLGEIYGERARMVVVLYRDAWGQTPWTNVEETAIKNRFFVGGQKWDFLFLISLGSSGAPAWLPRQRIWYGFDEYGLDGAVAAIEARFLSSGGELKQLSLPERAAKRAERIEWLQERHEWFESHLAVAAGRAEWETLTAETRAAVEAIAVKSPRLEIEFIANSADRDIFQVRSRKWSFSAAWTQHYANTLRGTYLYVTEWVGPYGAFGVNQMGEHRIPLALSEDGTLGWARNGAGAGVVPSATIAEEFLERLIDSNHPKHPGADL